MELSHKTQAALQFLAPTAVVYFFVGACLLDGSWPTLSSIQNNSGGILIMGISAMLIQDLVPKPIKEFLVFWRIKHRLPGHRAFSEKNLSNPLINRKNIPSSTKFSKKLPEVQQREFYNFYRTVADKKSVSHYSQRYIAWRDLSTLLVLLSVVGFPVLYSFETDRAVIAGITLSGLTFLAYILTSFAARNVATELVVQVFVAIDQESQKNG